MLNSSNTKSSIPSILNYKIFDFFNIKFDLSSYLKFYRKYYLLWHVLLIKNLK